MLTYRTIWLGEGPSFESHPGLQGSEPENRRGFEEVVDEWIGALSQEDESDIRENETRIVPVVFVALHACGSLTPAILQEALDNRLNRVSSRRVWFVAAVVVVGCCYNLMGKQGIHRVEENIIQKSHPFSRLSSISGSEAILTKVLSRVRAFSKSPPVSSSGSVGVA